MGAIYKLVEVDGRPVAKWSEDKASLPGSKQIFRFADRDVLALAGESCPEGAEALLRAMILKGQLVERPPDLEVIRKRAGQPVRLPHALQQSEALIALVDRVRGERR